MMNSVEVTGLTRICSIVPRSFSRTTESAVATVPTSISRNPMMPGIRNRELSSVGLYQTRGSRRMGDSRAVTPRVFITSCARSVLYVRIIAST